MKIYRGGFDDTIYLKLNDGRTEVNHPIEKPEAIKIVNYLKNHFEI